MIAGNTRLKAAQELGMAEVPVWWFDGSGIDAVAFAVASRAWSRSCRRRGNADAERLRETVRKAIALLKTAVG